MKYLNIIVLFLLINQIIADPYCGFPTFSNNTESHDEYVKIERCTKFYEHPEWTPCKTIFEGKMKKGEYFTDPESSSSDNSFIYMGDGSVCYSVYSSFGECNYISAKSGCLNSCITSFSSVYYGNIYDYYSCISKVDDSYNIFVGGSNSIPSSANKLKYSILFLFIIFALLL